MTKTSGKTDKSKIQMLQSITVAQRRNPEMEDLTKVTPDTDGTCSVGENIGGQCKVHPLVVAYMEEDSTVGGAFDVNAAVSLDEGTTWKRINLSNNVKRVSTYNGRKCFKKEEEGDDGDGDDPDCDGGERRILQDEASTSFTFQGDNFKPTIVAKGSKILVAWTSKNCKGGVPGNQGDGDGPYGGDEDDNDPHNHLSISDRGENKDRHLVKGRQMCVDYSDEITGAGNVPFSCVWAARGEVGSDGKTTWTKPERLTSGRRDAFQLVAAVAGSGTAWALAWQEDPKGLRVGEAAGPGDGMSGATVNHKADIWYSYLSGANFAKWESDSTSNRMNIQDVARFSVPVRVTDNAACKIDETGSSKGAPYCQETAFCASTMTFEEAKYPTTCVTEKGIPLNGDTGASRPNMFLLPDDQLNVRVVLAYEESKGLGKGPGSNHDETTEQEPADREDWGKNIYYHTFQYDDPDEIAHGSMINLPEVDESNKPIETEDGTEFLTRNARRVRIIMQPKTNWGSSGLAMVLLYREGDEGHGHPAHIIMRRFINGYEPENLECQNRYQDPKTKESTCVKGSTDVTEDNIPEPGYPDDARSHRGFLRGDVLVVGYTYTTQWGRSKPDDYDFFVRRSFDGGKKWTNANGLLEGPRNLSKIREVGNRGWSVMEPRLYGTPGTIGKPPVTSSDVQNSMVYYVAYSTTHNPRDDGEKDKPMDLYWTMTDNFGESYMKVFNDEAQKWQYPSLAKVKGETDDAGFAGAQIQTNPAGTKLFASFQANVLTTSVEAGGGPCRGNGMGSDVCSNSTATGDTLLEKYDFTQDGRVDAADKVALANGIGTANLMYDLNGDGIVDGQDNKFFIRWPMEEGKKRVDSGFSRRAYLRGRE